MVLVIVSQKDVEKLNVIVVFYSSALVFTLIIIYTFSL